MRILLATASLMPAHGGPAYSVSALASALAEQGVEIGVWAADQSSSRTPLLRARDGVTQLTGTAGDALRSFGRFEVVHDNGIWMPHNHALARLALGLGVPRLVSTRGMLEPWARNHKRVKKTLAWHLYQHRDLRLAQCLHATAEAEARNLEGYGLGVEIVSIPNGVDVPAVDTGIERRARPPTRIALFLGRLYPIKGLPQLIAAWARLRPAGWHLRIAGPDEAGHRALLERAVGAARLDANVTFVGQLHGAQKTAAFSEADLFVLPSHSESFGMAVAESLAHGLPVLTTTAVPWPMLESHRCGWRVAPTVDALEKGLALATSTPAAELSAMGARGRDLVRRDFGWPAVARRFVETYRRLSKA